MAKLELFIKEAAPAKEKILSNRNVSLKEIKSILDRIKPLILKAPFEDLKPETIALLDQLNIKDCAHVIIDAIHSKPIGVNYAVKLENDIWSDWYDAGSLRSKVYTEEDDGVYVYLMEFEGKATYSDFSYSDATSFKKVIAAKLIDPAISLLHQSVS